MSIVPVGLVAGPPIHSVDDVMSCISMPRNSGSSNGVSHLWSRLPSPAMVGAVSRPLCWVKVPNVPPSGELEVGYPGTDAEWSKCESAPRIVSGAGVVAVVVGTTGPAGSAALYPACPSVGLDYWAPSLVLPSVGVSPSSPVDSAVCSVPVLVEPLTGTAMVPTGVLPPSPSPSRKFVRRRVWKIRRLVGVVKLRLWVLFLNLNWVKRRVRLVLMVLVKVCRLGCRVVNRRWTKVVLGLTSASRVIVLVLSVCSNRWRHYKR